MTPHERQLHNERMKRYKQTPKGRITYAKAMLNYWTRELEKAQKALTETNEQ